jgi:hypothetical protein
MMPIQALETIARSTTVPVSAEYWIEALRAMRFVIVPIEPDDAAIERVARAIADLCTEDPEQNWPAYRREGSAAYTAVVKEM